MDQESTITCMFQIELRVHEVMLTDGCLRIATDSCKFNHDIKKYLDAKDKDIGDRCVNFENTGE